MVAITRKRKYKARPIIRITADHIGLISMLLDAGILFLLVVWFLLEAFGILGGH